MDYRAEVIRNCPGFDTDTMQKKLSLSGLGVAGEAGEVADLAAALICSEYPHDEIMAKLKKELGDVYWYLEYACASLNITREEALIRAPYSTRKDMGLLISATDLAAKAGLVADTIKKVLHHEVPLTRVDDKLLCAIGTTYRVLENIENVVGFTREEIQQANVDKLRARHPNGWTPESQQAKADEVAR